MGRKGEAKRDRLVDGVIVRLCRVCKIEKPLDSFAKQPGEVKGRHRDCKKCRYEYMRAKKGTVRRFKRGFNEFEVEGDIAIVKTTRHGEERTFRVSLCDIPKLQELNKRWQIANNGYVTTGGRVNYKSWRVMLHRFLVYCPDGLEIDHKNGDRADCTRSNLEPVTHLENVRRARARAIAKGVIKA